MTRVNASLATPAVRTLLEWDEEGRVNRHYVVNLLVKCVDRQRKTIKLRVDHGKIRLPDMWFRIESLPPRLQTLQKGTRSHPASCEAAQVVGEFCGEARTFTPLGILEGQDPIAWCFTTARDARTTPKGQRPNSPILLTVN